MKWKTVIIEGKTYPYEISDTGLLKNRRGRVLNAKPSGVHSYCYTCISRPGEKMRGVLIHRLVAEAFVPNPENKPWVNHINNCRTDNRAVNLEWATPSENQKHRYRNGGRRGGAKGEANGNGKLQSPQVLEIRRRVDNGTPLLEIARAFKIHPATIHDIIAGRTWRHVTLNNEKPESQTRRIRERGNPKALLTTQEVRSIRRLAKAGMGPKKIGEMFGVSIHVAFAVIKRKTYQKVT